MINTKTKGELGYRIEYDVEHDLFHPQNVYSEEYITPTFVEYVRKLEQTIEQLKKDNIENESDCANCGLRKENAELREEIENDKDLPAIAYQQGAEWWKEKSDKQLKEAKEIIAEMLAYGIHKKEVAERAKKFLEENK